MSTQHREEETARASLACVVFSYNRGSALEMCIASIRRYLPAAEIIVVDDSSTNSETLEALERVRKQGVQITSPPSGPQSSRGGLFRGIKHVLHDLQVPQRAALLVQDDMQIVRRVEPEEQQKVVNFLFNVSSSPIVNVTFPMRGKARVLWRENSLFPYVVANKRGLVRGWTDVCLVDLARIRDSSFLRQPLKWGAEEEWISRHAVRTFGPMPCYAYPFVAYTPGIVVYRPGNVRARSGIGTDHPTIALKHSDDFLNRDLLNIPFAESYCQIYPTAGETSVLPNDHFWPHVALGLRERIASYVRSPKLVAEVAAKRFRICEQFISHRAETIATKCAAVARTFRRC